MGRLLLAISGRLRCCSGAGSYATCRPTLLSVRAGEAGVSAVRWSSGDAISMRLPNGSRTKLDVCPWGVVLGRRNRGAPTGDRVAQRRLRIVEDRADLDLEWPLVDSSPLYFAHAPAPDHNGSVLQAVGRRRARIGI